MASSQVHSAHCCRRHGCKYSDESCPVKTGEAAQEVLCEICSWSAEDRGLSPDTVGETVFVVLESSDESLSGLPTEAEIAAALNSALQGLEVKPGWTVKLVRE